jgi:ubiquinone/menaquinone biosynthesis C-methylase UbiE
MGNRHINTVDGFGDEWERYDQTALSSTELELLFQRYFHIFPWGKLNSNAIGFDMGCGSGRWAKLVAPRVGKLFCIDPSSAIDVAKSNLKGFPNSHFINAGVGDHCLDENSMDFGYSLGVLHHVPKTSEAIKECVSFLKKGSPFLIYLYYKFDNRSKIFVFIWRCSELIRAVVSKLPHSLRFFCSNVIALLIYFPLSKLSFLMLAIGIPLRIVEKIPLSSYRDVSFYTMRTDALDRFGTQLEQRFTQSEIRKMMTDAGLENIVFSTETPFWCAVGYKK